MVDIRVAIVVWTLLCGAIIVLAKSDTIPHSGLYVGIVFYIVGMLAIGAVNSSMQPVQFVQPRAAATPSRMATTSASTPIPTTTTTTKAKKKAKALDAGQIVVTIEKAIDALDGSSDDDSDANDDNIDVAGIATPNDYGQDYAQDYSAHQHHTTHYDYAHHSHDTQDASQDFAQE